jgi:hypothetical protein
VVFGTGFSGIEFTMPIINFQKRHETLVGGYDEPIVRPSGLFTCSSYRSWYFPARAENNEPYNSISECLPLTRTSPSLAIAFLLLQESFARSKERISSAYTIIQGNGIEEIRPLGYNLFNGVMYQ